MNGALTKRVVGGAVGLAIGTLLALAAPLTYAQTNDTASTTSTAPGAPATGVGDTSANMVMLGISALALVAGGTYLARARRQA